MEYQTVLVLSRIVGLVLFIAMFVVFCAWTFRPGARRIYEDAARIPFRAPEEK